MGAAVATMGSSGLDTSEEFIVLGAKVLGGGIAIAA